MTMYSVVGAVGVDSEVSVLGLQNGEPLEYPFVARAERKVNRQEIRYQPAARLFTTF